MKIDDSIRKPPYLKLVGHRGKISIWTVDGTYVRTHLDEEFTNFGQHLVFDCIPPDEFWLDKEAENDEQKFFIDHLLLEHRLMLKGVPYDDALEAADKAERAERKKSGDVRKLTKGGNLPDPTKVHEKLWKTLESGVHVWIVNGRLVRSVFDDDFTKVDTTRCMSLCRRMRCGSTTIWKKSNDRMFSCTNCTNAI